jgi:divalent metal cation (Fe/Co/Zn/Cd) transporter
MSEKKMRPIWFFVSLILMVMGGIIFLSGIYNLIEPPVVKTVLANTHPDIWWGGVMIVFGGLLYLKTRNQTV